MRIVVIGGGYIGQLVQYAMPTARVLDWRKVPPKGPTDNRIGPQYLWEPIPGLKSTKFEVLTLVDGGVPSEDGIRAYKKKIGKENDGGDWGLQFKHRTVGWHSQLPEPKIEFGQTVSMIDLDSRKLVLQSGFSVVEYDVLVSTIPLPSLLGMLMMGPEMDDMNFKSDAIHMFTADDVPRDIDETMTLNYLSDPNTPWYRETRWQRKLYRESIHPQLGCRKIVPGKIHPHPESSRVVRELALANVWCFGRFATWSPDELAHETWKKVVQWRDAICR